MEQRGKALPQRGQGVLHPKRHLLVDLPAKKAVLLQFPQLPGEGGMRDPLQPPEQLPEPLDAVGGYVP